MHDVIEIRGDGEVVANHMLIARVEFLEPWTRDAAGVWYANDGGDEIEELHCRIDQLDDKCGELEEQAADAREGARDAEQSLTHFADELRACLASGEMQMPKEIEHRLRSILDDAS